MPAGIFWAMLKISRTVKACPRAGDLVGSTQEPSRPCVLRKRNSSHTRRLIVAAEKLNHLLEIVETFFGNPGYLKTRHIFA